MAYRKNEETEAFWFGLEKTGSFDTADKLKLSIETARALGFSYYPAFDLSKLVLHEVLHRVDAITNNEVSKPHVDAVLGGVHRPQFLLSQCLEKFWDYSKPKLINKSANQIRKWKNQRTNAMRGFVDALGDKNIVDLVRADTLKYRDALIVKVERGELIAASANKQMVQLKCIIECISDNADLKLDIKHLFQKLALPNAEDGTRSPFTTEYLLDTLLTEEKLKGLNEEAKNVLYAFSETGAGFSELVGLLPEDIILDHAIPHIIIKRHDKHGLKTKYRIRTIPLVGFALDAFKAFPDGFTSYFGKPDSLSTAVNKFLRENDLLPSDKHSVYSLRHSFQDRLTRANAPDRVQADLMGHKFTRPTYGDGSDLQQKLEWLQKIQLKNAR